MLEKTDGAIKNGQSRETGNIGYTRYKTKTHKAKNTTQKTKTMSKTRTIPKPEGEPSRPECYIKKNVNLNILSITRNRR